jgi:hypothetical protein
MATDNKRRNLISQIQDVNGQCLFDQAEKAEALWVAFRNRLGISEFSMIHYDLNQLINSILLPAMDHPFSEEEIKAVLSDMPSDHALDPDGFNSLFMKKCWDIIEQDFEGYLLNFIVGLLISNLLMVPLSL